MDELTNVFNYGLNEVRIVMKNGEPWFSVKNVCEALELSNPTVVVSRLDSDEVTKFNLGGLSGETNFVNEAGLYTLILGSRKPEAKQFKRWITHEVIPAIRKHGTYMTPETIEKVLADPDTIIKIATDLKEERLKRQQAELKIQHDKPKVLFADAVSASKTSILIGDLAKLLKQNGYDTGQKRLFNKLRNEGFLIKRKGSDYNSPTQRAMEMGLFEVKETAITHSDGHVTISKTTKVTGKGQQYFINRFLNSSDIEERRNPLEQTI